ncbi:MAG: VWA domain-containing protein [Planctomycetales bacterium]|nr:VWA domain-containing protein [Planctomycetales bacterium]
MLKRTCACRSDVVTVAAKRVWGTPKPRRGATMAMLAVMMPIMLAVSAFAINLVYMEMVRTELQITTDLATRAAGRTLAITGDQQLAIDSAERMLSENQYANQTLTLADATIEFGVSTRLSETERYAFSPGINPNAIRVQANPMNELPMLFPTMGVNIPLRPIRTAISTQVELDIALVLDRSGSMAYSATETASGSKPSAAPEGWSFGDPVPPHARWLDLVDAVDGFLQIMESSSHDERVSLTTYSSNAKRDLNLSNDYDAIRSNLDSYSMNFSGGSTNVGGGILDGVSALGMNAFARPWATRVMIVMTDGIHNKGTDPLYAAQQAAGENVLVYTVTFSDEADQISMQDVAAAGAGKHYHAANSEQLADVFREIARSLPTLITF